MADAAQDILIGVAGPRRHLLDIPLIRAGLMQHGARTRRLHPGSDRDWHALDAVVIAGGAHIHPRRYRSQPSIEARYNPPRDEYELALLEYAQQHRLPVLGICRGAQLLNIFHGGTLHQDITPLRRRTRPRHLLTPMQTVRVMPHSRLARILKRDRIGANRLHSQSVLQLGRGLRVSALDPDHFVQAVESVREDWQIGVQWHPEYLLYHPAHRKLFRALVDAARRRKLSTS